MSLALIKLTKLDKRHSGTAHFRYRVCVDGTREVRVTKFLELREWCYSMWGVGMEREFANVVKCAHWGWHTGRDILYDPLYIYLVSDAEASLFKLKWC
jgi:hypothetical protein